MKKKMIVISLVTFVSVILTCGFAFALSGPCVNCHTMHDSQGNATMQYVGSGPKPILLRGDCWGCHGQGTASNLVNTIPQVFHSNVTDLAGGNFGYVSGLKIRDAADGGATLSSVAHNVRDLGAGNYETVLTTPPGDQNSTGINASVAFTCAGTKGCHGDRTAPYPLTAVRTAHHGNVNGQLNTATTVANSYRFLKGVKGTEDADWQITSSATDHNEYFGASGKGTESTISVPGAFTMSGLCAECHGTFHGPAVGDIANASNAWLRHPTDVVLPNSGEYQYYNGTLALGKGTYSLSAPVARVAVAAASSTVTPGTDVVSCLSCHKAHGTANADLLRWNYASINAGTGPVGTSCFICHTAKDGSP